ncbi:hypothetical protein D9M68_136280 [compost metagenome]
MISNSRRHDVARCGSGAVATPSKRPGKAQDGVANHADKGDGAMPKFIASRAICTSGAPSGSLRSIARPALTHSGRITVHTPLELYRAPHQGAQLGPATRAIGCQVRAGQTLLPWQYSYEFVLTGQLRCPVEVNLQLGVHILGTHKNGESWFFCLCHRRFKLHRSRRSDRTMIW